MCIGYLKDGDKFHKFLNEVIGIQVSVQIILILEYPIKDMGVQPKSTKIRSKLTILRFLLRRKFIYSPLICVNLKIMPVTITNYQRFSKIGHSRKSISLSIELPRYWQENVCLSRQQRWYTTRTCSNVLLKGNQLVNKNKTLRTCPYIGRIKILVLI